MYINILLRRNVYIYFFEGFCLGGFFMSWISSQYPSPNVSPYCHDGILIGQHFVFFHEQKHLQMSQKHFFFCSGFQVLVSQKTECVKPQNVPANFWKIMNGNHELKAMKEILLAGAPWLWLNPGQVDVFLPNQCPSVKKKSATVEYIYIYIWYKSQIYKKYIWMIYVKCISWPTGKKFYNWIYWPVYLWIHTPNWSTVSDRGHQPPGGGADLRHTSEVVGFRVVGGKSTTVAAFCGGFPLAIREMSEVVPQDFFCFGKKFFFW